MPRALHVTALDRLGVEQSAISGSMKAPAQSQIYRVVAERDRCATFAQFDRSRPARNMSVRSP